MAIGVSGVVEYWGKCKNMLTRVQLSIQILKEATAELWQKISQAKKEELVITSEINKEKDQEKVVEVKNKLESLYNK